MVFLKFGVVAMVGVGVSLVLGEARLPATKASAQYGRPKVVKATGAGYKVAFTQVRFSSGLKDSASSWWGAFDDSTSDLMVVKLTITHGSESLRVPRSVYADLANINRAKVVKHGKGCLIEFDGGDASVGYEGRIVVIGDTLAKRTVAAGEFPESQSETTTYVDKEVETD